MSLVVQVKTNHHQHKTECTLCYHQNQVKKFSKKHQQKRLSLSSHIYTCRQQGVYGDFDDLKIYQPRLLEQFIRNVHVYVGVFIRTMLRHKNIYALYNQKKLKKNKNTLQESMLAQKNTYNGLRVSIILQSINIYVVMSFHHFITINSLRDQKIQ